MYRFLLALLLLSVPVCAGQNVFDVAGQPATRALVTMTSDAVELEPRSDMLDQLSGLVADLSDKEVRELRGCAGGAKTEPVENAEGRTMWFVRVSRGEAAAQVEILQLADGRFAARREGGAAGRVTLLNLPRFAALAKDWARYSGGFPEVPEPASGRVETLARPYAPSWLHLDREVLRDRFWKGRDTKVGAAVRSLASEEFLVRLPTGYSPRGAAGVVVWVDAGNPARLHPVLHAACDELGLILVGAVATGNDRPPADRWQLALDAVETARTRYLIDVRRVYASGISGGGKIASHVWACFPEVFTGAVPIVGLDTYHSVPAPGGKIYPPFYAKPIGIRWSILTKDRRCAAISGPADGNYTKIAACVRMLQEDGLSARLFEYPDMGHTLPTAPRFAEALRWVDEPGRTAAEARDAAARAAWEALQRPDAPPKGSAVRSAALVEVTVKGPWTRWGWLAAEELGAIGKRGD